MVDLVVPAITVGLCAASALAGWIVKSTRTSAAVETVAGNVESVKIDHEKRLDGHDSDLSDIRANFVSRRELDEKLNSSMATIATNYTNIKDQLAVHGRWLEYAVFNKKPDQPTISSRS